MSRRGSRGSVLLIVVVLLLLMAILGTAYLATTRVERTTSAGAINNTSVDLLADSAKQIATGVVVNALFDPTTGKFRPTTAVPPTVPPIPPAGSYDSPVYNTNYNAAGVSVGIDNWLADRVPQAGPAWGSITAPLNASSLFESPDGAGTYNPYGTASPVVPYAFPLSPTYKTVAGSAYPAFTIGATTFVAGDAAGAGVADCGLVRLPGVSVDGLTYYLGLRIIDNNSAVNVNTAWDNKNDFDFTNTALAAPLAGYPSFPSSVGLAEVLDAGNAATEITALNTVRFGAAAAAAAPFDDTGASLSTFSFVSSGDALYHQLSRRLANPGYLTAAARYRAFGDADGAALAYHGCLVNPSAYGQKSGAVAPTTAVETALIHSTFQNAPNYNQTPQWSSYPYVAASLASWYANFAAGSTNARPLLVTRNGVSIQCPAYSGDPKVLSVPNAAMVPYGDRGRWQSAVTYAAGDVVTCLTSASSCGLYFSLQSANINHPPADTGSAFWARPAQWSATAAYTVPSYVFYGNRFYSLSAGGNGTVTPGASADWTPWTPPAAATGVKANANTALFPELMRAYWNVMAANTGVTASTPFGTITSPFGAAASPLDPTQIYVGNQFKAYGVATTFDPTVTANAQRMFRSSVRDNTALAAPPTPTGMVFDPTQMMQLRAAIAAVNTENLRSPQATPVPATGSRTIIARQVPLTLQTNATTTNVNVVVYGNQPQPFIVEVYAQSDIVTTPSGAPGKNASGYVAVKLFNPYPFDMPLVNPSLPAGDSCWRLATIDRSTQGKTLTPLAGLDAVTYPIPSVYPIAATSYGVPVIPANGYLLLENYGPSVVGAAAAYRPGATGLPLTGAIDKANLQTSPPDPTTTRLDGSGHAIYLNTLYVPALGQAIGKELVLMKRRNADGTASAGTDGTYAWDDSPANANAIYDFVPVDSFDLSGMQETTTAAEAIHYVRENDPDLATPAAQTHAWKFVYPGRYDGSQAVARQQGTQDVTWAIPGATDPWDPTVGSPKGTPPTPGMALGTSGNVNTATSTVNDAATWSQAATYPTPKPFAIQPTNANWAGPNKPGATGNTYPFGGYPRAGDVLETPYIGSYVIYSAAVGRVDGGILEVNPVTLDAAFAEDTDVSDDAIEQIGRFCPLIVAGTTSDQQRTGAAVRYGWARSLFDYLTVEDPRDDYLPAVDPNIYAGAPPIAVNNGDTSVAANTETENTQSVQGLVNINTAPYRVLRTLPLIVKQGTGALDQPNTDLCAAAIVADRTKNGPFLSVFDLNRVVDGSTPANTFQNAYANLGTFTGTATAAQGDLTPASGIANQFDELYLQVNRLSNLVTTRSDTFTVYAVVEGWQNAGAATAKRVVSRRVAFILDRNTVTPAYKGVRTVTVPNN